MAYIQALQNRDGEDVYPVTTAAAVYLQTTGDDGSISQQPMDKLIASMKTSFQAGVDTIVSKLKSLGVTPSASTPDGIVSAIETMNSDRYTAGQNSVTVSQAVSGRTVTATLSNGKTASSSVALGTNSGNGTATLTPTGNNTTSKSYAAGYYDAFTVTANGATAYKAGHNSATLSVKKVVSAGYFYMNGQTTNYKIRGLSTGYTLWKNIFPVVVHADTDSASNGTDIQFTWEDSTHTMRGYCTDTDALIRVKVDIYTIDIA